MRYIKTVLVICLCFVNSLLGVAQTETLKLSLSDVIAIAQSDAPDVLLAKTRLTTDYWSYQSFLADFKPQIDLGVTPLDIQRTISPFLTPEGTQTFLPQAGVNSSFDVSLRQDIAKTGGSIFAGTGLSYLYNFKSGTNPSFKNYYATPIYVGFNQPLFAFNQLKWNKKMQPLEYDQSTKEYAEQMEQVATEATELFFDVYNAQINIRTREIDKANADTLFEISKGRFSVGRIAETDLLQIELSVRNAESSLAEAMLGIQRTTEQLRNFLGIKEVVNFELIPPDQLPDMFVDADKALGEARKNRSQSIELQRRLMEADMNLERAEKEAGLNANITGLIGLNNSAEAFSDAYKNPLDREEVALRLQVPLADWGKAKARRKIAESNKEFITMDVEQTRINFEREVLLHVQQFDMVKDQVNLAYRAYEISQRREEITRKRYMIGKIEVIDLNLAIREKDEGLRSYMTALRNYWTSYYRLRRLTLYDFENDRSLVRKVEME